MIQPSSFHSAFSVLGGNVLPSASWPCLPIGSCCHSRVRSARAAAAFITLTHSGTTSCPMSSPERMPSFKAISPGSTALRWRGATLAPRWSPAQLPRRHRRNAALARSESAIYGQGLAGNGGGTGPGQEHDRGCDFLRRDEAAGRNARPHPFALLGGVHLLAGGCQYRAGCDRIDANISVDPFDRQHARHLNKAALGGTIGGAAGKPGQSVRRGDIDDNAGAPARYTTRRIGARPEIGAAQIGVEHVVPLVPSDLERRLYQRTGGVVDQYIDVAESLDHDGEGLRNVRLDAQIEFYRHHVAALHRRITQQRVEPRNVAARHCDVVTRLRQPPGDSRNRPPR